jgi:glycine cleavage system H protein
MTSKTVKGFELRLDRSYDLTHHMWALVDADLVRVGMDALGVETSGTLAHLAIGGVGDVVTAGNAFGSLEAEKYVGPLVSPVSGTVTAVNVAVLENPGLVHTHPYDTGWMIEIEPSALGSDLATLVNGEQAVEDAFSKKVTQYRLEGVLAE